MGRKDKENKSMEDKKTLLHRLVKMAKADSLFKKEEYKYLQDLSDSLGIKREVLLEIIESEIPEKKTENLLKRAKQMYRLAIMMLVDGTITKEEMNLLKQYTIELGFDPNTCDVMIQRMEQNKGGMLFDKDLIEIFSIQNN